MVIPERVQSVQGRRTHGTSSIDGEFKYVVATFVAHIIIISQVHIILEFFAVSVLFIQKIGTYDGTLREKKSSILVFPGSFAFFEGSSKCK